MAEKKPKSLVGPLKAKDTQVRKVPEPKNVGIDVKVKPYALAKGTPREMNDQVQTMKRSGGALVPVEPMVPANKLADRFMKEEGAKAAAIDFFEALRPWCERFNKAGLEAINVAIGELQAMPSLVQYPRTVTCEYDKHTGMTAAVKLWIADPQAAIDNEKGKK